VVHKAVPALDVEIEQLGVGLGHGTGKLDGLVLTCAAFDLLKEHPSDAAPLKVGVNAELGKVGHLRPQEEGRKRDLLVLFEEDDADDALGRVGWFPHEREIALAVGRPLRRHAVILPSRQRTQPHRHLLGIRTVQQRGDRRHRILRTDRPDNHRAALGRGCRLRRRHRAASVDSAQMKGHAQRLGAGLADLASHGVRRPPSSGTSRLRVRYCECDPMGVAHHAAYVPWLEIGRTELLRESGIAYAQLEHAGIFLVIVKLEVRYRRPILYDDVVEVRTRVQPGSSKVKIEHTYELVVVERAGKPLEEVAAAAATTLACVNRDGNVQMLPEWLGPSASQG
jgi:acyl-CoA thioester hydrolase